MNTLPTSAVRRLAPVLLALSIPLAQAADGVWTLNNSGTWSTPGNWSGNIIADGAGFTADFSQLNINGGTRTITIDGAVASRTAGSLFIGDTDTTHGYTIAASGGGTLTFNNSGVTALLTQSSTSGANSISAPIILADNLSATNNSANLLTLSGGVTGAKNLTLNAGSTGGFTLATGSINNGGTITNSGSGSGTSTISAVIGTNVTGIVQDSASSQLTLSGTNLFTGTTTIKKGSILVSNSAALGVTTGSVLLGDTSGSTDASLLIGSFTVANNITAQAGSSGNTLTIAATGASAARLTGNLTLSKDVTLTVSGGSNAGRNTGAYLDHRTGTITGAGNLNLNITGNVSTSNNGGVPVLDSLSLAAVASTGSINNIGTGTGRAIITGNITAAAGLNQNSASSVLTLSGTNSYSGATNVNAGVLRIANAGALSATSAVTVASGGTLLMGSVTATAASSLSIAGNGSATATGALAGVNNSGYAGTVTLADDATISSDLTGAGTTFTLSAANSVTGTNKTLTVTGVDHTTISGTITTGSGGLVKSGAGILTLSGANTFTGLTRLNGGTLNLNHANALGGGGSLTFGGGSLQYTSANTTDFGSRIVNSTGTLAIDTNGQSRTLSSVAASNTAGLTKLGSGTLTLSGTNAYTGITAVNTGNLTVSTTASLPTQVFIDTNGALNSGGAYADVTAWLGGGKIATGSTGALALTGNSSENINLTGFGALGLGASSNATYSGTLTPAGSAYRLGGGGAILTLSGTNALTGANTLAVNGSVTLTGANNLSGATTVAYNNTGGTNTLTLSGANGNLASSAITVAPTATLAIVSDTTTTAATRAASVTLNRGTLNVTGNNTANSTDAITGAFTVGADGFSTVTLTPGNKNALLTAGSYARNTGGTVLFRGTALGVNSVASKTATSTNLQFATPNLVGNAGTGTDRSIFVGALGSTATNGTGFGANAGLLTQDSTYGVRILTGSDYATAITDGQTTLDNVQLTSTGTTLNASIATATTINSLSLNSTAASANVQLAGAGKLTLNSGVIYANSVTSSTASGIANTVNFNGREGFIAAGGSANLVLSGVLEGTGGNGLTVYAGVGRTVTFSGTDANTYTGTTTVNGGTLLLQKTSVNAIAGDVVINAGAAITANSNQIADTAGVTINGGTLTASNETIASLTVSNGGQFAINTGNNPGQAFVVSGNASVSGYGSNTASLLNTGTRGNTLTIGGTLTLADGGRLIVNSSQNVSGTIDGSATVGGLAITHRASGAYTAVTVSPNGSQNSTQKGGQLILNGDVSFTGNTSNTNTVFIDAATGQGTRGNVALTGATPGNRSFTIGDGAAANDLTVSASLVDGSGGASGLVKTGAGTLALSAANTYTGGTTITGGLINFNTLSSFGSGAITLNGGGVQWSAGYSGGDLSTRTVTINSGGGTFDTNGNDITLAGTIGGGGTGQLIKTGTGSLTIGTLSSTGGTNVQGGSLTIGSGGASGNISTGNGTTTNFNSTSTYSNVISGTGTVAVNSGTVTFSGANTYTGATHITGGTLLVDGSLANTTVTVDSGATLGGHGTIGGATTVNGSLNPGNSPGVLTFSSGLTLGSGSTTNMEITGLARGTQYDGIDVTGGTLTYGGTLAINFSASTVSGTTYDLFNLSSGSPSGSFSLVSIAGTYVTSLTNSSGIWTGSAGGFDFTFTQSTGDLAVLASAIPEPASAALLAGVGLLGFALLRRKTRSA